MRSDLGLRLLLATLVLPLCVLRALCGEPIRLTTDGSFKQHLQWSPDDKTLVPHKAFEESPRWSPDGKLVLWVSTRNKNPDLYTVDAEGKNEKRLTTDPAYDLHPAWKPDGKQIAFASGRSGRQKIHLINADGTEVKKLTDGEFLDAWPAWRPPQGKQLAF